MASREDLDGKCPETRSGQKYKNEPKREMASTFPLPHEKGTNTSKTMIAREILSVTLRLHPASAEAVW